MAERDWTVVHVFSDQPTSVKKGQDRRPGELALLNAILIWLVGLIRCCFGPSTELESPLSDLVGFMETCRFAGIHRCGCRN